MDTEIFTEYFKFQNPSYLFNDLCNSSRTRNVKKVNNALIDLRNGN